MNTAGDAQEEARRLIAEARESGQRKLRLDGETTRALGRLPAEIGDQPAHCSLDLDHTQVNDLAPLAGPRGRVATEIPRPHRRNVSDI